MDHIELSDEYIKEHERKELSRVKYRKSNRLILAKNGRTSATVHKLFTVAISECKIDPKNPTQAVAVISGQKLRKIFNNYSGSFYESVRAACNSPTHKADLMSWRLGMEDPSTRSWSYCNVVSEASFSGGVLKISMTPEVTKEITNLKSNYTELLRGIALSMDSAYSIQLYERLTSHIDYTRSVRKDLPSQGPYFLEMSLEELRDLFTLDYTVSTGKRSAAKEEHLYSRFADMKRYVLSVAADEVNLLTNLKVTYKPVRCGQGARITGVVFTVVREMSGEDNTKNNTEQEISKEEERRRKLVFADVSDFLSDEDLSVKDIKAVCAAAGYDADRIKAAYDLSKESPGIGNLTGWLISAVKEGYQSQKQKKKASPKKKARQAPGFMNFEQNEYDFEELEEKLLNTE